MEPALRFCSRDNRGMAFGSVSEHGHGSIYKGHSLYIDRGIVAM